jgi:hypothetical protein
MRGKGRNRFIKTLLVTDDDDGEKEEKKVEKHCYSLSA